MEKVVSVSYGEIALKGANKSYFVKKLRDHIKASVKDFGSPHVYQDMSKMYIEANDQNIDQIVNRVKKIFGIVQVSKCYRMEKEELSLISQNAIEIAKEKVASGNFKTFKAVTKRGDKKYPLNSMEISRQIGGDVFHAVEGLTVDVHDPDFCLYIDIRQQAYVYTEKIKACGGLPIGTNGRGLLLLSGGIDSPVAGYMMAKRGLKVHAVHYHSYPFTSERAEEKVKDLAKIISMYCGEFKMHSINLLDIQKEINEKCPEDEMTIISRRFMMRIAEKIAKANYMDALITGESMGQVASQTIQGLNVTNSSVNIPVFRPLIGMDKTEIMDIARDIETYETSILPHEDCCTVFLPKHPVTRPKLEDIEKSEEALDVERLIEEAIAKMEVIDIRP